MDKMSNATIERIKQLMTLQNSIERLAGRKTPQMKVLAMVLRELGYRIQPQGLQ